MSFFSRDERAAEENMYTPPYDRNQYASASAYGPRDNERTGGPSQVPYPWRAQWDDREGRYIYLNEQTGERTWEYPSSSGGGSYGAPEPGGRDYGYEGQEEQKREGGGHGLLYGALGAAAGLAGGAFLAHEAGDISQDFEADKSRLENNVEDFPSDAARWTGEKVQEVEDVPQDVGQGFERFGDRVEEGWDGAVEGVEDAPADVAGWVGRRVGEVEGVGDEVERFGDGLDNAYDQGKDEERREDGGW